MDVIKCNPQSVFLTSTFGVVCMTSTRGLGKALAREFLRAGDNVVIASRRWVSTFLRRNCYSVRIVKTSFCKFACFCC